MSDQSFTFSKRERLSSRKTIGLLFESGRSFYSHPFKVVWLEKECESRFPASVAISVPKKVFKRAVDRNRIKRVVRESWRHQKGNLYSQLEQEDLQIVIMLIFTARILPSQIEMNGMIEKLISKFSSVLKDYRQKKNK